MNPYGDIDLTRYLQTEGRRRAAALAKAARERNAPSPAPAAQPQQQKQQGAGTPGGQAQQQQQQQQGDTPGQQRATPRQPSSLTEVLVQMGVAKPR